MNRPPGGNRPVPADELIESQTGQVFHRIVKGAVGRVAEVVNLDGVPIRERSSRLNFALEAAEILRVAGALGADQFDGAWPAQHEVFGTINFTHAASSEQIHELILTNSSRCLHLFSHALKPMR